MDPVAPVPGTKRELLAWIWYPAAGNDPAPVDDYLPEALRLKADSGNQTNIFTFLTRPASKVRGHSLRGARVAPGKGSYAVAIFRAGASSGVLNYSSLAEDLASHGFVVVGFDAPWRTGRVVFPDGRVMDRTEANNPETCVVPDGAQMDRCASRVIAAWTGDIAFALEQLGRLNADSSGTFTGRLDLNRLGVVGHSFGGATAAQFCHDDPRCKAGIDIDGAPHGTVVQDGIRQPFMFLLSDHGYETDSVSGQIEADIASIYDRQPPASRLRVAIRGAFHYTFSDDGAVMKSSVLRGLLRVTGRLRINTQRQLAVTSYCIRTFFDAHLKGKGPPAIPGSAYPEVVAWNAPVK